ncbi:MAG: carboxypeptidase-like regulatory domain-containing protein [Planctomycetota bacterium]
MNHSSQRSILFCIGVLLVGLSPAMAHRISLFASVHGNEIHGYAFGADGNRIQGATVHILPAGGKEERVSTGESGRFVYRALRPVDHHLRLALKDGHETRFLVRGNEFGSGAMEQVRGRDTEAPVLLQGTSLQEEVRQLRVSVNRLREEQRLLAEEKDFRDLIGGVGYLVGLAGIVAYLVSRRRRP